MRTTLFFIPVLGLGLAFGLNSAGKAAAAAPQAPAAAPAPANSPANSPATPPATPQAPAAHGMTVTRDTETGELRAPTAAELQALQRQAPASAGRPFVPQAETGPDGRRRVYLGESRLVHAVVTRAADGKLEQHCVHGDQAAGHIVNQAPAAATHKDVHHDHR